MFENDSEILRLFLRFRSLGPIVDLMSNLRIHMAGL